MGLSVSEPGHQHDGPGVWNEIKARPRFISFQDSDSRDTCNFPHSIPFHLFNISVRSLRDLRSILYFSRERCRFDFFLPLFLFFFLLLLVIFVSSILEKNFYQIVEKKDLEKDLVTSFLPSFLPSCLRIVSRSIHLLPSFFFLLPPFSRIGNSILEKAKNVVDKRPWRNAVRTFLCTIEYDCEIIDNLEWLHRQAGCISYRDSIYIKNSACGVYSHRIFINIVQCFPFSHPFFFFNFYSRSKSQFICIHSIRCVCKIWNEKKK